MTFSTQFREFVTMQNRAIGAQNAHLRVILLDFSTNPPTRRVFQGSRIYGRGAHTEPQLFQDF